jgi:hypothetical protein
MKKEYYIPTIEVICLSTPLMQNPALAGSGDHGSISLGGGDHAPQRRTPVF